MKRYQLINNEGKIINVTLDTYLGVMRHPLDSILIVKDINGGIHSVLVWKNK